MNKDFLVVDFEFTQYWKREKQGNRRRGFFSEIIEIGAVKFNSKTLDKTGEIHNFVHPHFYPNVGITSNEELDRVFETDAIREERRNSDDNGSPSNRMGKNRPRRNTRRILNDE
jgi:hypothetical protein